MLYNNNISNSENKLLRNIQQIFFETDENDNNNNKFGVIESF